MIPDSTHLGSVSLLVKNLQLEKSFYTSALGLKVISEEEHAAVLGWINQPLIVLHENQKLPYAEQQSAGLYHTALLYSSAGELARTLYRIFQIAPNLFQGSGDHLVSQAFYLTDPEGNGIELYIDRPRSEWQWKEGQLQMDALPIDMEGFIREHSINPDKGIISSGHIHLKVGSITEAKQFYVDTLGFDIIIEHPTALFVSAGGYHHHIGLNTWQSENATMRLPALGLDYFEILVPDPAYSTVLKKKLIDQGKTYQETEAGLFLTDPWGTKSLIIANT
jgi:catechol 2,3-dioxygenase